MCLHKSGKVVTNDPSAPPSPNEDLMLSTEVDSYLRGVSEASTGQEALWRPGPVHPNHLKRLQTGLKRGKGHKGGAQGGLHYGLGGFGRNGRGPTIINSSIHYHKW